MELGFPLKKTELFQSSHLNEIRTEVGNAFCSHNLQLRSGQRKILTNMKRKVFASSALVYLDYGSPVIIEPGVMNDFYIFQFQLAGEAQVFSDGRRHLATPLSASVLNPVHYIRLVTEENCRFLSLKLDRLKVEESLSRMLGDHISQPLIFDIALDMTSASGQALMRNILFCFQELEMTSLIQGNPEIMERYEEMLIALVLHSQHHNYSHILDKTTSKPMPRHIKRAISFMADNIEHKVSLDDVATFAGVTVRSLSNGFREFQNKSPMAFLAEIRLEKAHQMLVKLSANESVTAVALQCGFTHLGRFSASYKAKFGCSPLQSLRKYQRLS